MIPGRAIRPIEGKGEFASFERSRLLVATLLGLWPEQRRFDANCVTILSTKEINAGATEDPTQNFDFDCSLRLQTGL